MTDLSEEILTRLEDLATAMEDDVDLVARTRERIQQETGALFERAAGMAVQITVLQGTIESADTVLQGYLQSTIGAPLDMATSAVDQLRTVLDDVVAKAGADSLDEASDEVATLRDQVEEFGDTVAARIEEASSLVGSVTQVIEETLDAGRDAMENAMKGVIEDVSTVIDQEVMTPITDQAERLGGEWTQQVEEAAFELVEELFEQSRKLIEDPINQALDHIQGIVEAEINTLVAELTGGDDAGAAQREALNQALELIKDAFDPMKDAFEQFLGLASMVGIDI